MKKLKKAHIKLKLKRTKLIFGALVVYLRNSPSVMEPIKKEGKFKSFKYLADESKEIYFCGCKMSKRPPFCDGSHSR